MRVLLDTHILLWALSSPSRLSTAVRSQINQAEIYVSAASIWEISIKSALGKLRADAGAVLAGIEPAGFLLLSISCEHAARVPRLPAIHKDPFDRMLIAQATVEPMQLLTNDLQLRAYGSIVTVAE